jgi:hypothetical protein
MLFTIQSYLEDHFRNRGLIDSDGYSVKVANLYYYQRGASRSLEEFLLKFHRVKTVFYLNNRLEERSSFEKQLVSKIERKFGKYSRQYLGKLTGKRFIPLNKSKRVTIESLLLNFKSIVEAGAIDSFWKSRKKNQLKDKPEKIAQALLASCLKMALNGKGIVVRELSSGIGFVDLGVMLSSALHLIEVKILTKGFLGVEQLWQYMKTENRRRGILVVLDAMSPDKKVEIPKKIESKSGEINVLVIDINPSPPSSLNVLRH